MPLSVADQLEIQNLYSVYNTAIDTGDAKTFQNCYTPDCHFDPGHTQLEGQEAMGEFAAQTHSAMPLMRHNATNIVIEGEGSRAQGSAFLIGYLAGPDYKVIVTGRYSDELVKTDDGWRFSKRVFKPDA